MEIFSALSNVQEPYVCMYIYIYIGRSARRTGINFDVGLNVQLLQVCLNISMFA